MGFRTVVMLNNDRSHQWSKDPELGNMIQRAMNFAGTTDERRKFMDEVGPGYGKVVECVHADVRTLAILGHYTSFEPVAYTNWWSRCGEDAEQDKLDMLKRAAEELGYHIRKKPIRKPRVRPTKGE